MTPFQRFIRLYDVNSVLFVGCGLALAGLVAIFGGYLIGSRVTVVVGSIVTIALIVCTILCAIIAMMRGDRFTPARDIILTPHLGDIREDELKPLDDVRFMIDLAANVPQFRL